MFFLSNIGGVVTVLKSIPGKKNDSFKKKKKRKEKKRKYLDKKSVSNLQTEILHFPIMSHCLN